MNKLRAYWAIIQEIFFAPIAYILGARAYAVFVRFAGSDILDPLTDVLINKYQEVATPATAISKFDALEAAIYASAPVENIKIEPISFFEFLRNRCVNIMAFAS